VNCFISNDFCEVVSPWFVINIASILGTEDFFTVETARVTNGIVVGCAKRNIWGVIFIFFILLCLRWVIKYCKWYNKMRTQNDWAKYIRDPILPAEVT